MLTLETLGGLRQFIVPVNPSSWLARASFATGLRTRCLARHRRKNPTLPIATHW
jgi:hypothetical protein